MTTFKIIRDDESELKQSGDNLYNLVPGDKFKIVVKRDKSLLTHPTVHRFINLTRTEQELTGDEIELTNTLFTHLFESKHLTLQPSLESVNRICPITGECMKIVEKQMYIRIVVVYPKVESVMEHVSGYRRYRGYEDVAAKHVFEAYLRAPQVPSSVSTSSSSNSLSSSSLSPSQPASRKKMVKKYIISKDGDSKLSKTVPPKMCCSCCKSKQQQVERTCSSCGFPTVPMLTFDDPDEAVQFWTNYHTQHKCCGELTLTEAWVPTYV
jgi:hypothetical protein